MSHSMAGVGSKVSQYARTGIRIETGACRPQTPGGHRDLWALGWKLDCRMGLIGSGTLWTAGWQV